jgi:hypothetical protein
MQGTHTAATSENKGRAEASPPAREASKSTEESFVVVSSPGESSRGPGSMEPSAADVKKAQQLRLEGNDLYRKHELPKALGRWHKALRYHPGDARIHNNCAQAHWLLGDMQKSLECAEAAVKQVASGEVKVAAKAFYNRAQALRALGKIIEAAEDFERAQDLDPSLAPTSQQSTEDPLPQNRSSAMGAQSDAVPCNPSSMAEVDDGSARVSDGMAVSLESSYVHVTPGHLEPSIGRANTMVGSAPVSILPRREEMDSGSKRETVRNLLQTDNVAQPQHALPVGTASQRELAAKSKPGKAGDCGKAQKSSDSCKAKQDVGSMPKVSTDEVCCILCRAQHVLLLQ